MAFSKGFNFRATSGFVTDGTNETYVIASDIYPTVRNGVTFGWVTTAPSAFDSVVGNDRRLAGNNQQTNNGTQRTFRVDLPAAGSYQVQLAQGDPGSAQAALYVQVQDNGTPLLTLNQTTLTLANRFYDATNTLYTNLTWPTSETAVALTFATTTLFLILGTPAASTNGSAIAHLFVSATGPAPLTLYASNPIQGGSNAGLLAIAAPTASTSTSGWTVGTTIATQYSRGTYNTEVPTANFTATAQPSGAPVNLGEDCYRLSAQTSGVFSAGTWYSTVSVIAVTSGGIQDGQAQFRYWRSLNADGTSATEITQGIMVGSRITELSTTVAQSSSASTQVSTQTFNNEYLFLQLGWETL